MLTVFLVEFSEVDFFHDENGVCPFYLFCAEYDFSAMVQPSAVDGDVCCVVEDGFCGGAAEFVHGADEE